MDGLGEIESREAFRGGVAQARDDEGARELGDTTEVRAWIGGFALLAFKFVVDCERLLAAERIRQALADTEVGAIFEWCGGGCVVNADEDAIFDVGLGLECAASRVAHFANEDGGLSKTELITLDLEIVLCIRDVFVDAELRLGRALVLDFDLEVKRWNALQGDWDDFFAIYLTRTVAVGLSGLVEFGAGAGVDCLADSDGRKVFF